MIPATGLCPHSAQDSANTCFCYTEPGHCTLKALQVLWACIKGQSSIIARERACPVMWGGIYLVYSLISIHHKGFDSASL